MQVQLEERIREIVNRYDPIKLIKGGAPDDEYAPEVKMIAEAFNETKSESALKNRVYSIFVEMFGRDVAGKKNRYRRLAQEIWKRLSIL